MNIAVTILGGIGATWLLASALYWQHRYRQARDEADKWRFYAELAAEALEAKAQQQQRPTLRFSRLDGEPGKVFDMLRADGSGWIVSRN